MFSFQSEGLGGCDAGTMPGFGSDYGLLSTNRYNSNVVVTSIGLSSERTENSIEMNSSSNDQFTHYSHIQSGTSKVSGCIGSNNSTINSSNSFHSNHNIGHFTPSPAFVSGPG